MSGHWSENEQSEINEQVYALNSLCTVGLPLRLMLNAPAYSMRGRYTSEKPPVHFGCGCVHCTGTDLHVHCVPKMSQLWCALAPSCMDEFWYWFYKSRVCSSFGVPSFLLTLFALKYSRNENETILKLWRTRLSPAHSAANAGFYRSTSDAA